MPKVQILSEDIISKIAAGEVIERPSSVVKELLENSLDAGSQSIELNLKDAGKTLIHIKDNGSGIEREDLEVIFARHATSKIKSLEDLFNIHSLGFRGEALYSIAAVSDVVVRSKTQDADTGWEIHLRGGKKLGLKPCAFSQSGTEIEIHELFFNTPARKKFLKSTTAEITQTLNTVVPYTLLFPQIRFKLLHQGRGLIDLKPETNLKTRAAVALNLEEKSLITKKQTSQLQNYSLEVVLGDINIKRTRRDLQFIFVNSRPVFSKNISYHMNQIYRLLMPPEEFPFFAVYITIPAVDVDVNVHPTKREVKIREEQALCSMLRKLSEEALMNAGGIKTAFNPAASTYKHFNSAASKEISVGENLENVSGQPTGLFADDYAYPRYSSPKQWPGPGSQQKEFFIPDGAVLENPERSLQSKLENARFVGNFMNKFLLFESETNLLIIDQHAAAERITYEQLIRQMEKGSVEVQNLLTPVTVKLTLQEMLVWEESQKEFEKLGLSTSQFGENTIAVHTQPQLLKDVEKAVHNILSGENISGGDHDAIARRACRSSIMSGDKLTTQQAEFFREQLLQCLDPFTCPHGRPTVIEVSEDFLDKQFLRT